MMRHTCTIQRRADAPADDYGYPSSNYIDSKTGVKCRFSSRISNLRGIGGLIGEGDQVGWRELIKNVALILFPPGTVIDEGDRVTNVRDHLGNVVEAGPFNPLIARTAYGKQAGVTGHHVSVIVERIR
jgi:hypothetical protein